MNPDPRVLALGWCWWSKSGCPRSGKKSRKNIFFQGQGILKLIREILKLSIKSGKCQGILK